MLATPGSSALGFVADLVPDRPPGSLLFKACQNGGQVALNPYERGLLLQSVLPPGVSLSLCPGPAVEERPRRLARAAAAETAAAVSAGASGGGGSSGSAALPSAAQLPSSDGAKAAMMEEDSAPVAADARAADAAVGASDATAAAQPRRSGRNRKLPARLMTEAEAPRQPRPDRSRSRPLSRAGARGGGAAQRRSASSGAGAASAAGGAKAALVGAGEDKDKQALLAKIRALEAKVAAVESKQVEADDRPAGSRRRHAAAASSAVSSTRVAEASSEDDQDVTSAEKEPESEDCSSDNHQKQRRRGSRAGRGRGRGRGRGATGAGAGRGTRKRKSAAAASDEAAASAPMAAKKAVGAVGPEGGEEALARSAEELRGLGGGQKHVMFSQVSEPLSMDEKRQLQDRLNNLSAEAMDRVLAHLGYTDCDDGGDVELDLAKLSPPRQHDLFRAVEKEFHAASADVVVGVHAGEAASGGGGAASADFGGSPWVTELTPRRGQAGIAAEDSHMARTWEECSAREIQRQSQLREARETASAGATPTMTPGAHQGLQENAEEEQPCEEPPSAETNTAAAAASASAPAVVAAASTGASAAPGENQADKGSGDSMLEESGEVLKMFEGAWKEGP